jgi:hypothetical protein
VSLKFKNSGSVSHIVLVRTKPLSVSDQCFSANLSSYSHYVFSAMDLQETGVITFEVKGIQLGTITCCYITVDPECEVTKKVWFL